MQLCSRTPVLRKYQRQGVNRVGSRGGSSRRVVGGGDAGGVLLPPLPLVSQRCAGRAVAACTLYGASSVAITFFNKAVFAVFHFHYPVFMTLVQILFCLSALRIASALGLLKLPPVTKELAVIAFPLAFFWWLYAVTGLVALRYLTIPMFSTLRKFTTLVVLVGEAVILRKRSPPSVWLSVVLIVAGGCLAGATDRSASAIGYLLVGICCVATAAYLVLIVRVGASSGLDSVGMLYCNNLLSLPLVVAFLAVGTSELRAVASFPSLTSPAFWGVFGASSALATVLNFSVFFCTSVNSPLATTVTGQIKDVVTISVGSFAFGDVTLTPPNVAGLTLSLVGSALFCGVKHVIASRGRRLAAAAEAKAVAMERVGVDAAPTALTVATVRAHRHGGRERSGSDGDDWGTCRGKPRCKGCVLAVVAAASDGGQWLCAHCRGVAVPTAPTATRTGGSRASFQRPPEGEPSLCSPRGARRHGQ
nr:PhM00038.1 [Neoporphyra haitanensis]